VPSRPRYSYLFFTASNALPLLAAASQLKARSQAYGSDEGAQEHLKVCEFSYWPWRGLSKPRVMGWATSPLRDRLN